MHTITNTKYNGHAQQSRVARSPMFVVCNGFFVAVAPGSFANGFSIAIQIRWQFRFTLTSILTKISLHNFVHGTTTVLSWHVQKIVAIWGSAVELQQDEVSIEIEFRETNR